MAKRTRVTTSVSTLRKQIDQLKLVAKLAGRKDLSKVFADISIRVTDLEKSYESVKNEIAPFIALFNVSDDEEEVTETE